MTPGAEPVFYAAFRAVFHTAFHGAFHAVDRGLLRCASLLVPVKQRAEWRLEWESELWHVRRLNSDCSAVSLQTEYEIAGFCIGAFQDAACLRRLSWQIRPRFAPLHSSAIQCLFWLASLLLVSYLCSLLSSGVRAEHDFTRSQVRSGTILIEDQDNSTPTIAIDQVRLWEHSRQRYADGFAFYRVAKETVQRGPLEADTWQTDTWQIAQASSNLFAVIGWSLRSMLPDDGVRSDIPRLVLSERIWRQRFESNPEIIGKVLLVGARPARVIGIAPSDSWRLPGNSDAWLLESDSEFGRNNQGFVIAHLTPSGRSEMWGGLVPIYDSRDSEHAFLGVSLEEHRPAPWSIYWFAVFLAMLALPAIASVSLADYSFSAQKPSWIRRAVRSGFLGAKIALILLIAYFSSIDLAYWHFPALSPSGTYIQLGVSFAILLFGIRWALLDQSERCPVCLRRVTHPAQVGSFSKNVSGVERNRAYLHQRTYTTSRPWLAYELVRRTAMDVFGFIMEFSVCRIEGNASTVPWD